MPRDHFAVISFVPPLKTASKAVLKKSQQSLVSLAPTGKSEISQMAGVEGASQILSFSHENVYCSYYKRWYT
jgi:hypothetical protein